MGTSDVTRIILSDRAGGELYEKLLARRKQVKEDHEDAVRRECAAEVMS